MGSKTWMTPEEVALKIIEQPQHEETSVLHLSGQRITQLPTEIGQLKNLTHLYLSDNQLTTLPESIGQLKNLTDLYLNGNKLTTLPESIGQLKNLTYLYLDGNQLTTLPESICQLKNLTHLYLDYNQLTTLPESIGQLKNLTDLYLDGNQLTTLPESIVQLKNLTYLNLDHNQLTTLPQSIVQLENLTNLCLNHNQLKTLPESIGQLKNLTVLYLHGNQLTTLPESIGQLENLTNLCLHGNQLTTLPESIGQLTKLTNLRLEGNQLTTLPESIGQLTNFERLALDGNPLNPSLASAHRGGRDKLLAYLRSLAEPAEREKLYEAKLLLVGEGDVGKTTLLKALTGREPKAGEPTTHGVEIAREPLDLPHPDRPDVELRLNAWDFGGQEVYRVTHQFFFSRRSIYLLVWEPRAGVQQCQVEDWLKLIRLRVGDDARVIIISTHARTGNRIARIDKPVLRRNHGSMIVDFLEVDSLVDDPETGEKVGVARLKQLIGETAAALPQMGMPFNRDWRQARDELLARQEPRIPYTEFAQVCEKGHNLKPIDTETLAGLMHDLGHVVHYGDDPRLKNDVILRPGWLTKAIGFVLEDRKIQESDGILPDSRLAEVWRDHPFEDEPRYEPALYPFFLRLMGKYDVSYRLEDQKASLVAQHVPQVKPELPWVPDAEPGGGLRRIGLVCQMGESPPGLVPWMIVRTHEHALEHAGPDGRPHRHHWEKGMFLKYQEHGTAHLELHDREFHVHAEAVWPEFFMAKLQKTITTLITDNWPGLKGRYSFAIPCRGRGGDQPCQGRFQLDALRHFLENGAKEIPCQFCFSQQDIVELLFGFEEPDTRRQLSRIEEKVDAGFEGAEGWFEELRVQIEGLESRIANYVMALMHAMANEAKNGPRLFTIKPADGKWELVNKQYRLHLWCEAEGCQHPVLEEDQEGTLGVYQFPVTRKWVKQVAPYANLIAGVLKTVLPVAAPAANVIFGAGTIDASGIKAHLDLMKQATGKLLDGELDIHSPDLMPHRSADRHDEGPLTRPERSGILALHSFLREHDRNHERLGLIRMPTYTGDYLWLCPRHYDILQPPIPDKLG